jgi:hypothetical protein
VGAGGSGVAAPRLCGSASRPVAPWPRACSASSDIEGPLWLERRLSSETVSELEPGHSGAPLASQRLTCSRGPALPLSTWVLYRRPDQCWGALVGLCARTLVPGSNIGSSSGCHVPRLDTSNFRSCKSYCFTVLFSLSNTLPNILSLVQSGVQPVSTCLFTTVPKCPDSSRFIREFFKQ